MTIRALRAKSWNEREYGPSPKHVFLAQHLADVHAAAHRVLEATADDQLRALGLAPDEYRDRLRRCVLLAAALHDLGKANDHFQGMIYACRDVQVNPQGLRHEWVTLLMLAHLREWLLPALGSFLGDFAFVEWAIVGHHPSPQHDSPPRISPNGAGAEIELFLGQLSEVFDFLKATFAIHEAPPQVKDIKRNLVGHDEVFAEVMAWSRASRRIWDKTSPSDRKLVAAIKNCLIAADVAGSALPRAIRNETHRWNWITESFADKPEPGDLQKVVDERARTFVGTSPERERFQLAVENSADDVTFVKAGCGSGKTQAAYRWAAKNHPARRLYFCYPTTGTATEGFKDYLFDDAEKIPLVGAKLFHSRRDVDFEIILDAGNDTPRPFDEVAKRLEALEAWSTPIVACTVDTVLGLVQNNKRGLFAWPALAQSAFVFDEIHAFDDRLFGALLRFLRDLPGLPVLLMTASLPAAREEALRNLLAARGQSLTPIAGPIDLETMPRYHHEAIEANDPLPAIRRTIASGGKVLWVCNTVARVMDAAAATAEFSPLLYHSRFKYEHRVARHKAVIDAFNPKINSGQALAICSQVAEMSLDLSADLLVTDLATVPALIQRLGRLNRRARPGDKTRPFVVIDPSGHLPYTAADLIATKRWLERLPATGISQRHLVEAWEQTGDQPPDLVPSAWLDGGPVTTVSELREASPGITVLMHSDREFVRDKPDVLPRFVLPMPPPHRSLNWQAWPRERGIPIAPPDSIDYDPLRGAQWQKT